MTEIPAWVEAVVVAFSKRLPSHADREAVRGAALEAYCVADRAFQPGRGPTRQSWVSQKMWYAMLDELRRAEGFRRNHGPALLISGDAADEETGLSLFGRIGGQDDLSGHEVISMIMRIPNERLRRILVERALGFTQEEIAAEFEITPSRVSQLITSARRTLDLEVAA